MVLVYLLVGLLNIFTQHHNYGIKIEDKNFDIRVRRSIEDTVKPEVYNIRDNLENVLKTDVLKREKRHANYKRTNDLLKYSSNNNTSQNQTLKKRYDIFDPKYNYLFNTTKNNQNNNTGVNNGHTINSRPLVRSYPYAYPPGYEPRPNRATRYNVVTTAPGYRSQNDNTPVYYNYQNPNGPNFAGYVGYTASKPGYENVTPGYENATPDYYNAPVQYELRSSPNTKSTLAPYPPSYTQNPINNNNNFNNIPVPFNKDNIPQYVINFNNGTTANNNTNMPYAVVSNTTVTPTNDYIFPIIDDYNPSNNTNVFPTDNNNVFPTNNNNTNVFPTNNTIVTPSNINSTVTTTPRTLSGCVICNIPCPQFMRRFGMYCMPESGDDDY